MSFGLALLFTIALMVWMGFFMLGSLPLLVLEHDTPLDGRFIRGLFHVYYLAVLFTATAAAPFYAMTGLAHFAVGLASIAVFAFLSKRHILERMDALRAQIQEGDTAAIRSFRKVHITGMLLNVLQLAAVACSLPLLNMR